MIHDLFYQNYHDKTFNQAHDRPKKQAGQLSAVNGGIPESVLLLAGFVLAHAAWNVSDLPAGDLLVPLAIIERNGQRQLKRFEAETQDEAISEAKETLHNMKGTVDARAFAREGLLNEDDAKVDVLSVTFWAKGMKEEAAFVQQFEPNGRRGKFRLIGKPMVIIGGVEQTGKKAAAVIAAVMKGVSQHSKVQPMWAGWKN